MDPENTKDLSSVKRALLAVEKMKAKLEAVEQAQAEPLAIVGIGCRFAGGASTPEAFWEILRNGTNIVSEVPADRWDKEAFYDPDTQAEGKMNTRWGAFLEKVDHFDPEFFGISPKEAAWMDPQQRVLLEVAWEALENAGQRRETFAGSQTGVFVGICNMDYAGLQSPLNLDVYSSTGLAYSIAANRISYLFDLRGPSIAIDTACSSSLVALHLASQSLRARESNMALVGGVNLVVSPAGTIALSKLNMMSPDGQCKTFDASSTLR